MEGWVGEYLRHWLTETRVQHGVEIRVDHGSDECERYKP